MGDNLTFKGEVLESLSAVEVECLRGVVAGGSPANIASRLNLGGAKADAVKNSLMRKLGAKCTADAVREGINAGL